MIYKIKALFYLLIMNYIFERIYLVCSKIFPNASASIQPQQRYNYLNTLQSNIFVYCLLND